LLGRHGRRQIMGGGDRPVSQSRMHGARFDTTWTPNRAISRRKESLTASSANFVPA
jgi:hypothetical protein